MNYKQCTPQGQPEDDRAILHTSIKTLTITQFIYIKHNNHNHYNNNHQAIFANARHEIEHDGIIVTAVGVYEEGAAYFSV